MHNLQCSEGMIKHASIHFPQQLLKKEEKKRNVQWEGGGNS